MLGTYKSPTNLENCINTAFKLFKTSIIKNFLSQVNDEELKGESCKQYNFSFYLAIYLISIVYQDVIKYPKQNWNYFVIKYKLETYKKCLACSGINLDDVLKCFNLPTVIIGLGINSIKIESTFIIEPTNLTPTVVEVVQIDLTTILGIKSCINNITTTC